MPRVVGVTVGLISCLFLALASTAYSAVACLHVSGQDDGAHDAGLRAQDPVGYAEAATSDVTQGGPRRSSKMSYVSVADAENEHMGDVEEEMAEFHGGRNTVKYVVLRVVIVVVLVVLAIVFKDHRSNFADFVGASCIMRNCILPPIVFYLVKA
ncbi:hypothetical protein PR003_g27795 [Phytophthora rubi]|uniref:Amino acid transporter transmembrane domain-containing protein n=1 Tax=Phytophthora rubi TaxID=129364 RepID=A0A6A4BYV7_9STRA|nr:hypothetical protein PR003_g27795 [Phytophthora rubi]